MNEGTMGNTGPGTRTRRRRTTSTRSQKGRPPNIARGRNARGRATGQNAGGLSSILTQAGNHLHAAADLLKGF